MGMLSVALVRLYASFLALLLPLVLTGSWAGADTSTTKMVEPVLIISQRDCRQLTAYYLSTGLSALFDEDERERTAAPPPATLRLAKLEDIAIDVTGDLQKRLGLTSESLLMRPDAGVGNVLVRLDGRAAINGQILDDDDGYALAALCRIHGQTPG